MTVPHSTFSLAAAFGLISGIPFYLKHQMTHIVPIISHMTGLMPPVDETDDMTFDEAMQMIHWHRTVAKALYDPIFIQLLAQYHETIQIPLVMEKIPRLGVPIEDVIAELKLRLYKMNVDLDHPVRLVPLDANARARLNVQLADPLTILRNKRLVEKEQAAYVHAMQG